MARHLNQDEFDQLIANMAVLYDHFRDLGAEITYSFEDELHPGSPFRKDFQYYPGAVLPTLQNLPPASGRLDIVFKKVNGDAEKAESNAHYTSLVFEDLCMNPQIISGSDSVAVSLPFEIAIGQNRSQGPGSAQIAQMNDRLIVSISDLCDEKEFRAEITDRHLASAVVNEMAASCGGPDTPGSGK